MFKLINPTNVVTDVFESGPTFLTSQNPSTKRWEVWCTVSEEQALPVLTAMEASRTAWLTRRNEHDRELTELYRPATDEDGVLLEGVVTLIFRTAKAPKLFNNDGTDFTGTLAQGSLLKAHLTIATRPSNLAHQRGTLGTYLYIEGIRVVEAAEVVDTLSVLGIGDATEAETFKRPDDWETLEEELRQARLAREAQQEKSREQEALALIAEKTAYETDKALNGAGRRNYR